MAEKWILEQKKGDFRGIAQALGVDPLIGKLMVNRGITTLEEARVYLHGDLVLLREPSLLKDGERAARLLLGAIRRGEKIAIASDFDDDGIFSAYVLKKAIFRVGGQCAVYTPDRIAEGYGLNERIVREALADGARFLLTCDNGIAAGEAVALAKNLGMTVVVTDHHEVPFTLSEAGEKNYILPAADAVVNPKQADCLYPFKGLCGAGVAFQVIRLLYRLAGIPVEEAWELVEYVAIATVADVMDLVDENRILVREGLKRLSHTAHPGLKCLIELCGLTGKELSSYHIGFIIGPCFNAAGRLDTVKRAFDLLEAENLGQAAGPAAELKALNDERKSMTMQGLSQAVKKIEKERIYEDPVMMVVLEDCHESLAGIIAGRIRERYHHPVYVFTKGSEGLKGSGRSIEAYSMFEKLSACKELLSRFGGHPMAAGLSLPEEHFPELKRQLCREADLTEEDFRPVVKIDAAMPLQYATGQIVEQMNLLEPFGKGNGRPLFAEQHFAVERMALLGKNRNALRLQIRNRDGVSREAVWFGETDDFFAFLDRGYGAGTAERLLKGRREAVDVAFTYYPEFREYRGQRSIQFVLKHYCRIR